MVIDTDNKENNQWKSESHYDKPFPLYRLPELMFQYQNRLIHHSSFTTWMNISLSDGVDTSNWATITPLFIKALNTS